MTHLWASIDIRLRVVLVILAIALLPVAWYLGSPLLINKTVDESFPGAAMPAQNQPAMISDDIKGAADPTANAMEDSASGAMPAATAASSAGAAMGPTDAMAGNDSGAAMEPKETAVANDSGAAMEPKETAVAGIEPVALSNGQFGEIDAIHKGQGKATLFKLPDGKRVLRLEDFKVTNGPDLYVYLSGHPMPRNGEQVHQGGFEVAQLKGNIGNQNYELPGDLDLSQFQSVVIYCRRFSVVFSTAELKAGA
jgi:hypothetical protein